VKYTLDTNFITAIIKENQSCIMRLEQAIRADHEVTLNPIAYFESKRGLVKPQYARKLMKLENMSLEYPMLVIDKAVADMAAFIQTELEKIGQTIHELDTLIAATAIVHEAIVITRNVKHFARIPGIRFENWEDEVM
jgi:tRNA(fMet)-specific endonuclease VapC